MPAEDVENLGPVWYPVIWGMELELDMELEKMCVWYA